MSMSGWWSAASAASATRFTKAIAVRKSAKENVRRIIPCSSAQPGFFASQAWTSVSVSFVRSRAMVRLLRPLHRAMPLVQCSGSGRFIHLWTEGLPRPPGGPDLLRPRPDAHSDAGEERRARGGGLEVPGANHRHPEQVRLELH